MENQDPSPHPHLKKSKFYCVNFLIFSTDPSPPPFKFFSHFFDIFLGLPLLIDIPEIWSKSKSNIIYPLLDLAIPIRLTVDPNFYIKVRKEEAVFYVVNELLIMKFLTWPTVCGL